MIGLALLQIVPLIHPGLAAGAVAAGLIPLIVHLVNRRRHRRIPWAAMSFLRAASRRSARRVWLEHWLLLLIRIAVVVVLGLGIARPYFPATSFMALGPSRVHRVLLLDNSLSMSARADGGRSRFEVAHGAAQDLLATFPETDAVSLVTLARPAEAVIADAAYDRRLLRERLLGVGPTQRAADPEGAMQRALEILGESDAPPGGRTVYLLSDLPRRSWLGTSTDGGATGAAGPTSAVIAARQLADALDDPAVDLQFLRAAPGRADNAAVTRVATDSPLIAVGLPVRFLIEVRNFGAASARHLALQIHRDGEIIRREPLPDIEPGGTAAASVSTEFAAPGTRIIEARLVAPGAPGADALADDDARRLSVEVRETIPVLLVDGRPGATPLAGQAGFLATALAPRPSGGRSAATVSGAADLSRTLLVAPKVIAEPELAGEALLDYDVVALCNVPRLSAALWEQVGRFVAQGGGLLVFGGDLIGADNYNRFGYAEGQGLLPVRLGRPVAPTAEGGGFASFRFEELSHPIVREFAGHPESGLFLARFDRYLAVEGDPGREPVVLRYTDGNPAILASTFGDGRVVIFTSTANMDWNNLPGKGDFVSLMFNTVAYLSPRHGDHRTLEVGGTVTEPLTPGQRSLPLHVRTGEGTAAEGRVVPAGEGLAAAFGPVDRAGIVTLMIGAEMRRFAVNVASGESDLAPVEGPALAKALQRPVRFVENAAAAADQPVVVRTSELASLALGAVVVLLFAETWLATRFGSRRGGGGGVASTETAAN